MKQLLTLFIALTSFLLFGQKKNVSPYPFEESSLLWQITSPDLEDTSYLFGTMHLIQKDLFLFPDILDSLTSSSDVLVMELSGDNAQMELIQLAMMKNGTMFDIFSEAETSRILEWVKTNMNISKEQFEANYIHFKPFVLVSMITQMQIKGSIESYEQEFTNIAVMNDVPMLGLETAADQMAIFDELTDEEMVELVMKSIDDFEAGNDQTVEFQRLYTRQNVDSLYMVVEEEGGTIAKKQNKFLDDRNEAWIPMIQQIIADKQAFIAVGAGHLGGPKGVIRLLQKEGYTLTPIRL